MFTGYTEMVLEFEEHRMQQFRFTDSYTNTPWYDWAFVQYVDPNSSRLRNCVAKICGVITLDKKITPGGDKHMALEASTQK
jgi:hypothetical protein